jgi:hypothetical protein
MMPLRSGSFLSTRSATLMGSPSPKGSRPEAAKASTAPREKTSLCGPTSRPLTCSGDMKPGVPMMIPVCVMLATELAPAPVTPFAIPKSMSRGPSLESSTFAGFRSRCTRPPT